MNNQVHNIMICENIFKKLLFQTKPSYREEPKRCQLKKDFRRFLKTAIIKNIIKNLKNV